MNGWNRAVTITQPPADLICIYTSLGRVNPARVLIISADMMIHFYPCQHHKSNSSRVTVPSASGTLSTTCQQVSNPGALSLEMGQEEHRGLIHLLMFVQRSEVPYKD